jgi:predicted dehydrogenase
MKRELRSTKRKVNGEFIDIPMINIGMLGASFMCKAHVNGYKQMEYIFWPPPAIPHLSKVVDINKDVAEEAAGRYGFDGFSNKWQDLIEDENIDIFENLGPNDIHAEPCIAAAQTGKAIFCEKPLARNSEEAWKMLEAVRKYGVKNLCGYDYRFAPALRLAKKLIDDGKIGKIQHIRAQYLQEVMNDKEFPLVWRLRKSVAGSGVLGDLSHIIDLARWLCGEPGTVQAVTKIFFKDRPLPDNPSQRGEVDVDDAYVATVEFTNGAIGFFEGSRCSNGRKNYEYIEVSGELGSFYFNLENVNFLHVYLREDERDGIAGFRAVDVTEYYHPYMDRWWFQGHTIGWESMFVHQAYEFVRAVIEESEPSPDLATFEDGYKAVVVCDAILKASETGSKQEVKY